MKPNTKMLQWCIVSAIVSAACLWSALVTMVCADPASGLSSMPSPPADSGFSRWPDKFDNTLLPDDLCPNDDSCIENDESLIGKLPRLNTLAWPKPWHQFSTKFFISSSTSHYDKDRPPKITTVQYYPRGLYPELRNEENPDKSVDYPFNLTLLAKTPFDTEKRTILLIPGYLSQESEAWIHTARTYFHKLGACNVISLSWYDSNQSAFYTRAVANTPQISRQALVMLYYLYAMHNSALMFEKELHRLHIFGHSLGAHIAGFIGRELHGKVGRITGLDPAGPFFDKQPNTLRLDPTDATFVDAIHTNSGRMNYVNAILNSPLRILDHFIDKLFHGSSMFTAKDFHLGSDDDSNAVNYVPWYGIDKQVGHIDYYANNGKVQPGCSGSIHTCDHSRATDLVNDLLHQATVERDLSHDKSDRLATKEERRAMLAPMRRADGGETSAQANETEEALRQFAFASNDYGDYLTGRSFKYLCPEVVDGLGQQVSESMEDCAVPLDIVKPLGETMEELTNRYHVDFSLSRPTSWRKYYFRTHPQRPYMGENYLLNIRMDRASSWTGECALHARIKMPSNSVVYVHINKTWRRVNEDDFYGFSIPFLGNDDKSHQQQLREMFERLHADENKHTEETRDQFMAAVATIAPLEVSLKLSRARPLGHLEYIADKLFTTLDGAGVPSSCRVILDSIEIRPVFHSPYSFMYTYASEKPGPGGKLKLTIHDTRTSPRDMRPRSSRLGDERLNRFKQLGEDLIRQGLLNTQKLYHNMASPRVAERKVTLERLESMSKFVAPILEPSRLSKEQALIRADKARATLMRLASTVKSSSAGESSSAEPAAPAPGDPAYTAPVEQKMTRDGPEDDYLMPVQRVASQHDVPTDDGEWADTADFVRVEQEDADEEIEGYEVVTSAPGEQAPQATGPPVPFMGRARVTDPIGFTLNAENRIKELYLIGLELGE